ncbi:tRNA pseudouridine synthase-like 1 [Austrofundulus limnaeus]|uniref:tRNA pseudouridine synthase n=1 Tax=Austrofundulus limnaeus TaxID=52670 RepID=A0A2I4AQ30_AUSLI|nr:PREDICTED: tRNA pseudouridine synthase-like 1 [Austrofundulus limnaeus]
MQNSARYLIFFQYIGTKYSGVVSVAHCQPGKTGVQDHLKEALQKLKPLDPVSVFVSSRTDKGVHALSNSAHFDLQRRHNKPPFTEDILIQALNYNLGTEQIRVTRAHLVSSDFHARYHAQSRTYVYRIALGCGSNTPLPLTEECLLWGLRNKELDVGAMREAAALLVGTHDFSTFAANSHETVPKNPVKTMDMVSIQPGDSFAKSHFHREMPLLELTFRSKSFLYKQVRRMTGVLVAVGQGRLSVSKIADLLEARDTHAFPKNFVAPTCGLFLTNVDYKESDLQYSEQLLSTDSAKD